jgi:hypothetical protein
MCGMGSAVTVDDDEFRKALAPMVADIRALAVAVDAVPARHGSLPSAHSPGVRELGDERGYAERCSWTSPITDTHAHCS